MVRVSPTLRRRDALSFRSRLTRTRPETASFWARVRVFVSRANHSHLSMRWRSAASVKLAAALLRLQRLLEGRERGERRVGIGDLVAAVALRRLGREADAFAGG